MTFEDEARVMTRYLLGCECPPEHAARYAAAHRARGALMPVQGAGYAAFALRHPLLLPLLDAGAAFVGAGAMLRAKLHLVSAVLEASPQFAEEFLPRTASRAALAIQLPWHGAMAVLKAVLGVPLAWLVARWTR